jgi:hypothetical protein
MSTGEPVTPATPAGSTSLLADLESRQDELLRLLSELEVRTEQALAALGVKGAGDQAATSAVAPTAPAAPSSVVLEATTTAPLKADAQRPSGRPTTRRKAA